MKRDTMRCCRRIAGLLAGAVLASGANAAEREPTAGRDVVVLATPIGDPEASLGRTGGDTIAANDLRDAHAVDLTDHLRRLTGGVIVNEVQGNPLQPDIVYRGFTASPLLGTPQGLSVYVDGVRMNQPFGDVVSWDTIPTSAIAAVELVPGSNPLFGRNSLGGTLAIRTKDGRSDPGMTADVSYGSFDRKIARATVGASGAGGWHAFASADYFAEDGWRDESPSRAGQLFAKLGWAGAATDVALSGSFASTNLNGNGLQEQRLLAARRGSVYTYPDNSRNRAATVTATGGHVIGDRLKLTANVFYRSFDTRTFNGDINDDALGENVYQPSVAERAALAAAGYAGLPLSGETQANTPFPRFRCIANVLLNTEPNEKCNGLANRSASDQHEGGATAELGWAREGADLRLGLTYVRSAADFIQTSQFGYLTPDRGIVAVDGPGAFADGSQDSENAFDARVSLRARTDVFSAYASGSARLTPALRLDLAARFDHTAIHNRDRISPGGGTGSLDGDHRYRRLNPVATVHWDAGAGTTFSLAAAQTSRVPSAIELGCADPDSPCRLPNALAGDPPLDQVIARTLEANATHRIGRWQLSAGAFRTVNRDDILFVTSERSGFGYFRNFGRTRRQGVDVDVAGPLGPLSVSAHYTFLDATFRSAETVDGSANSSNDGPAPGFEGNIDIDRGDRIPLIPRHVFKAAVAFTPIEAVTVRSDLVAVSGSPARGNENNAHRPDGVYYLGAGASRRYSVVNLALDLRVASATTLYIQMNNALDSRHATAAQLAPAGFDAAGRFVARPFAAPVIDGERPLVSSTFLAPGSPRSIRVGLRIALGS